MLVFQTDYDGYFVGPNYADESPLEPGVWLIPGGCVTVEPPQFNAEIERARWVNNEWIVELIPIEPATGVTYD
jgi:hypothetical protein